MYVSRVILEKSSVLLEFFKKKKKQTTLKFMEVVGFDTKPSGISIVFPTPTLPHKHYIPQILDFALMCAQEKLGSFLGPFSRSVLKVDNLCKCVSDLPRVAQLGFKRLVLFQSETCLPFGEFYINSYN